LGGIGQINLMLTCKLFFRSFLSCFLFEAPI
jgi:hypothetical protein